MSNTVKRPLPSEPNDPITHESIHSSVLQQPSVSPVLSEILASHPKIVPPLLPFEEEMKAKWPYDPSSPSTLEYEKKLKDQVPVKKTSNTNNPTTLPAVQAVEADKPAYDKRDGTLLRSIFRVLRIISLSKKTNV